MGTGTRCLVLALLATLMVACQSSPRLASQTTSPVSAETPTASSVLMDTLSHGDHSLAAVMGAQRRWLLTPAGVMSPRPDVLTVHVGDTFTIAGYGRRVPPSLTDDGSGVALVNGAVIRAVRVGHAIVSAVGVDYCADQVSNVETCTLIDVVVQG